MPELTTNDPALNLLGKPFTGFLRIWLFSHSVGSPLLPTPVEIGIEEGYLTSTVTLPEGDYHLQWLEEVEENLPTCPLACQYEISLSGDTLELADLIERMEPHGSIVNALKSRVAELEAEVSVNQGLLQDLEAEKARNQALTEKLEQKNAEENLLEGLAAVAANPQKCEVKEVECADFSEDLAEINIKPTPCPPEEDPECDPQIEIDIQRILSQGQPKTTSFDECENKVFIHPLK